MFGHGASPEEPWFAWSPVYDRLLDHKSGERFVYRSSGKVQEALTKESFFFLLSNRVS
jgi:hypothetical protein